MFFLSLIVLYLYSHVEVIQLTVVPLCVSENQFHCFMLLHLKVLSIMTVNHMFSKDLWTIQKKNNLNVSS